MHIYLKGYYGYRNIGDEVLLLGVLRYLQDELAVTHVTLEADDPVWMQGRLDQHATYYDISITCVAPPRKRYHKMRRAVRSLVGARPVVVVGGGEVINMKHAFPHNGRNYLIQYPGMLLGTHRYYLLGGITTDDQTPRHVARLVRGAAAVILRDQTSYDVAHHLSPDNTTHYHDRAYDPLEQQQWPQYDSRQHSDYVILNIHPHLYDEQSPLLDDIRQRIQAHHEMGQTIYFVPGDMRQDKQAYDKLTQSYSMVQWRDRSNKSLKDILSFFAGAEAAAASRLHLLLLLQTVGHQPLPLSYHPKIQKVLGL